MPSMWQNKCHSGIVTFWHIFYFCDTNLINKRMFLFYVMPIIFLLGIILIALEDITHINKAAVAVGMSILLWLICLLDAAGLFALHTPEYMDNFIAGFPKFAALSPAEQAFRYVEGALVEALGDVSTTLFFVLASMAIVEVLDSHGAFSVITKSIRSKSKRRLVWVFGLLTFILSALLGNLATVIVMVAVLRKLVSNKSDRIIYACLTILTANAGGSWSPIGDVTTLLLWTGGNLSVGHQISHLILSSSLYAVTTCAIVSFMFPRGENISDVVLERANLPEYITHKYQTTLLIVGLCSLAMVPVLQSLFNLPPFMGVLFGLVVLWVITDIKAHKSHDSASKKLLVSNLFSKLDISTVLFFLGILMSVHSLKTVGFLTELSVALGNIIGDPNTIGLLLGVCSSFLDNVALVAASMGMYPIAEAGAFMADGTFWTFLAYCAVTGGSLLIIGSASGVTVMGMEKISFVYYLKKFSWIALISYAAGAAVYLLLF